MLDPRPSLGSGADRSISPKDLLAHRLVGTSSGKVPSIELATGRSTNSAFSQKSTSSIAPVPYLWRSLAAIGCLRVLFGPLRQRVQLCTTPLAIRHSHARHLGGG